MSVRDNPAVKPILPVILSTTLAWTQPLQALELAPLLGYNTGGRFEDSQTLARIEVRDSRALGLAINWESAPLKQYELIYSRQHSELRLKDGLTTTPLTDLDIHYLQFGGVYFFNGRSAELNPYAAGGLGLTWLNLRNDGGDSQLRPALNLAIGGRWQLSPTLALRAELRAYGTLINSNTQIICGGGCNVRVAGDLLTQFQLNTGLVWHFD